MNEQELNELIDLMTSKIVENVFADARFVELLNKVDAMTKEEVVEEVPVEEVPEEKEEEKVEEVIEEVPVEKKSNLQLLIEKLHKGK